MKTPKLILLGAAVLTGFCAPTLRAQDDLHVLYEEGRAAFNAGQLELAREKLALVLARNPSHPQTRAMMATIESKLGPNNTMLRRAYEKLVIEKIDLTEAELGEALQALKILAKNASGGKIIPNLIVRDPELAKKPVSLHLGGIPLSEALRYLGDLVGARVTYDKAAVVFSKAGG